VRILIAPDKFKGSLSGRQAAEAIEKGLKRIFPDSKCHLLPLADGGEGLLDAFGQTGSSEPHEAIVQDAMGREVTAAWLMMTDEAEKTAIIESSQANGLWRISEADRDPARASSYGVGQLVREAIAKGAEKIVIGIGGSATNDLGIGIASALGCHFLDEAGEPVEPVPENFLKISSIDTKEMAQLPPITVACDVANPLLGTRGATGVYGPQKGIMPEDLATAEAAHAHLSSVANAHFKTDYNEYPGVGAAGGIGYGLMTFCGAKLESGFQCIANALHAEKYVTEADLVFTAEGSIDSQTLEGKTPFGVALLAQKHGVPVYALAGKIADESLLQEYFNGLASIVNAPMTLEYAIEHASELLELAAGRLAHTIKNAKS